MINRQTLQQILKSLKQFPVVGLIGSRQVGKTTLAKAIGSQKSGQSLYLDLEKPSDLAKLGDPELYLNRHARHLVIIDEVQRKPELFPVLRALIDDDRRAGRFLILGSASPTLIRQSSETLAGRIIYHELTPLLMTETLKKISKYETLWLRGGYPGSLLAKTELASYTWRQAFTSAYLERDLPQLGIRVPAASLRRFWQMLAHAHGQAWNASKMAQSMGISAPTVGHYLNILEDTFLIRRLHPFHSNLKKRLVKSPKVYFRDSGLLHTLLDIVDHEQLTGHPIIGFSWEGFVIEQILGILPKTWTSSFFRSSAGAEIDLVLTPPGRAPIAIEIKYSLSPTLSRGFHEGFADLHCKQGFIIYPGKTSYPMNHQITVLSLKEMLQSRLR